MPDAVGGHSPLGGRSAKSSGGGEKPKNPSREDMLYSGKSGSSDDGESSSQGGIVSAALQSKRYSESQSHSESRARDKEGKSGSGGNRHVYIPRQGNIVDAENQTAIQSDVNSTKAGKRGKSPDWLPPQGAIKETTTPGKSQTPHGGAEGIFAGYPGESGGFSPEDLERERNMLGIGDSVKADIRSRQDDKKRDNEGLREGMQSRKEANEEANARKRLVDRKTEADKRLSDMHQEQLRREGEMDADRLKREGEEEHKELGKLGMRESRKRREEGNK